MKPTNFTHAELEDRRREMARSVARGEKPAAVASRFDVDVSTVRRACREFGVLSKRMKWILEDRKAKRRLERIRARMGAL
jgi:transposase